MTKEIRILILEDHETDAELAIRELTRAGIQFDFRRVESKEAFVAALDDYDPDLILSDFTLPQFTGVDALKILKEGDSKIPFVLCTGSLTEEVAVQCMKEGATDYILKSSLKRLPSAVLNALAAKESQIVREQAVEALRKSEMEFRAIVETTNEWIWAIDLQGRITYSNPAIKQILGYEESDVLGRLVSDFLHEDERELVRAFFRDAIHQGRGWSQKFTRYRDIHGNIRFLESNAVPAWNSESQLIGYRGSDRDITERKEAEERILHDAIHDELTGLANRSVFLKHLDIVCETARREADNRFAVLLLDIDRFKVVNDSLGHSEGDRLLKMLSERVNEAVRPGDLVARLGADEFAILITQMGSESDSLRIIQRIRSLVHETPFVLNERDLVLSTSIGVALGKPGSNGAELLRGATTAKYSAKARGLGQYQVFNESVHQIAVDQLQLETEMRAGIKNKEFRLVYQPIVKLTTGELLGFEALVRWDHPTRGLVSPADFISAAEESGLIIPLGDWILEESCRQLSEWQRKNFTSKPFAISVNISPKQFMQDNLASRIVATLQKWKVAPEFLKLEITESHLMENSESAIAVIQKLRDHGIFISLDDFGTGYSSLSYLHRLPVDFLKIDRSFVMRMSESKENAEIVSTIIKLSANLKLQTIAEGIETNEQLDQLRLLGCDFGQGYFFARPLVADEAQEYFQSRFTHYRIWPAAGSPINPSS